MFVSTHRRDLIWITLQPTSHDSWLAWLFPIKWESKHTFCFVQVDQTYQPWHQRHSLPPCGPYLATSNILRKNNVDTRYNGRCSESELFSAPGGQIQQIDQAIYTPTSTSEWRQVWLGGRKNQIVGSIAQLTIWKEAFGGEMLRNANFKQRRDGDMDQGLCGKRDLCGRTASSKRRDSNYATTGRYEKCWKGTIDNQQAWNNICGDVQWHWRKYEWSFKFRWWGGWGRPRSRWRRFSARQADQRWRTWMGNGHNIENSTALHGAFSAKANAVWWPNATRMGGRGRLLLEESHVVQDSQNDGSASCQAPNRYYCSQTITDNIWRAYAEYWYRPRTLANAATDFPTRM